MVCYVLFTSKTKYADHNQENMSIGTDIVDIIIMHGNNYCMLITYSGTKALNCSCIVCVCSHNIYIEPFHNSVCATYSLTPKLDGKFFFSTL